MPEGEKMMTEQDRKELDKREQEKREQEKKEQEKKEQEKREAGVREQEVRAQDKRAQEKRDQDKRDQEKRDQEKTEKAKSLEAAISQIDKQIGKGSVIRLGSRPATAGMNVVSSGSLGLDLALGVGGVPRGRVVEIFGPESSGKTTLTLNIIASVQRAGGNAVFIDAEHALQPSYARLLGVDTDNLYVSQPDTGEDALEIADQLVRSGAVDIVAIDSVAALVPRAEIEGEMGDAHVGLQARLMSQALRKLTGSISRSNTIVVFINQIRMKIGVLFGNPETTSGGNALKFYSSVRLDIRRVSSIKEGENVIGNRTKVRVVKNKVAPPFRACEFDILFDEGISRSGELIDLGLDSGLLQKSGTWISYGPERLGQGREGARQTLRRNPDLADRLEREIRVAAGLDVHGGGKEPQASAEKSDKRDSDKNSPEKKDPLKDVTVAGKDGRAVRPPERREAVAEVRESPARYRRGAPGHA
jgi:recombination protein RecA